MNRWMKSLIVAVAAGMLLGGTAFAETKDAIVPITSETIVQAPLASNVEQPAPKASSSSASREQHQKAVPIAAKGEAVFERDGQPQMPSRAALDRPSAAELRTRPKNVQLGSSAVDRAAHVVETLLPAEDRIGGAHAMPPLHAQTQHGMLALGHAESRASELPDNAPTASRGAATASAHALPETSCANDRADLNAGSHFERIAPRSRDAMFERVSSGVERFSFRSFPERPRINASRMAGYGL